MQLCVGMGLDRVAWCLGCPSESAVVESDGAAAFDRAEWQVICCTGVRRDSIGFRVAPELLSNNCDCVNIDLEFMSVHLVHSATGGKELAAELALLSSTPVACVEAPDWQVMVMPVCTARPSGTPPPALAMSPVQRRTTLLI